MVQVDLSKRVNSTTTLNTHPTCTQAGQDHMNYGVNAASYQNAAEAW